MVVIGQLLVAIINVLIMSFPTKKYLGLSFKTQIIDLFEILFLNTLIFLIIFSLEIFFQIGHFTILLYPVLYVLLYIIISHFFNFEPYLSTINIIKKYLTLKII